MRFKKSTQEAVEMDILTIARSGKVFTLSHLRKATGRNYYILKPILNEMISRGQIEQLDGFSNRTFYRLKV